MILLGIILFFGIVAYMLSKTETPVHLDGNNKPITTQDGLDDVIKETPEIVIKSLPIVKDFIKSDSVEIKKEIDAPSATEDFNKTPGGKQLTEHIVDVIKLNPDSKKHLNKRQRKTVDKIVKNK